MDALFTQLAGYGPIGLAFVVLLIVIRALFTKYDESQSQQIADGRKYGDALLRSTAAMEKNNELLAAHGRQLEMLQYRHRGQD